MTVSQSFLKTVPQAPGVYLMKDKGEQVLYVGKAGNLRKRLSSYARQDKTQHSKTAALLEHIKDIETILTRTEKEALILEESLIKKYRPKYNVILRDDKSYPHIKVTVNETWPRVVMTRNRRKDGARYFGPFSSSSAMWETLRHLNTLFPLRRCKGKELQERKRPCLNYQIGRCSAPCLGKISYDKYQGHVKSVLMVLEGKNQLLLKELDQQMKRASAELNFEEAAGLRDRIFALQKTLEKQVVVASHSFDQDIFGFARKELSVAISIMLVRKGVMNGYVSYFLPEPIGTDAEILGEALERFYGKDRPIPKEILLPFQVADQELLSDWLTDLKDGKVSIHVPQRGNRFQLIKMAEANASKVFDDKDKKEKSWERLSKSLRQNFDLVNAPDYIECLDISNISGSQSVGALVAFVKGEKEKSKYRHFKIRTVEGPDDYASMAEVLYRRFKKGFETEDLPQLLVIDGGKGQLQVAYKVLEDLDLLDSIDLISIAKEKEDEGEKIFKPGRKNPMLFKRNSPVLLFTMKIRDEAHRYGITFHRKWRRKKTLHSPLDDIRDVGPARKKVLLETLGSMKRIEVASLDQLENVPGIGKNLAKQIYDNFHKT